MSNRRRLAERWDSFAMAVLTKGAPPIQREEMRRAFYAGAQGFLTAQVVAAAIEALEECAAMLPGAQRRLFRRKVRSSKCPANGTKKTAS